MTYSPSNKNQTTLPEQSFLAPQFFNFILPERNNISFFCQSANLPRMDLPVKYHSTPLINIPYPGEKLNFEPLILEFIIQENMENFIEIKDWLDGLGFPDNYDQFSDFIDSQSHKTPLNSTEDKEVAAQTSDAYLVIMDSNYKPKFTITFKDAFPIALEGLDFDVRQNTENRYMTSIAIFAFTNYSIEKFNN